jgi:hypothetical protein
MQSSISAEKVECWKMADRTTRPTIVYFFVDEMGYGHASCLSPVGQIKVLSSGLCPSAERLQR